MLNITAKLEQRLEEDRYCNWRVVITFKDKRVITLEDDDLALDGCRISGGVNSSTIAIGQCFSRQLTLGIYNDDWKYDSYDFYGAVCHVTAIYTFEDGTGEVLEMGTFTITEPEEYGSTVYVKAYDDFYKADMEIQFAGGTTAQALFNTACITCGLKPTTNPLLQRYMVGNLAATTMTCRQMIGYCAMICGGNAVVKDGVVSIVTYVSTSTVVIDEADGGVFDTTSTTKYTTGDSIDGGYFDNYTDSSNPYTSGYKFNAGEFSDSKTTYTANDAINTKLGTSSIRITGVSTTYKKDNDTKEVISGSQGYVISVQNPLTCDDPTASKQLTDNVFSAVNGMDFVTCEVDIPSYPPLELCDMIYAEDHNGTSHKTYITDIDIAMHGFTTCKCNAEDPVRNGRSTYFSKQQIQTVKKVLEQANDVITAHDDAVKSFGDLMINALGLHTTLERDDAGAIIYYMHNKPNLSESDVRFKMSSGGFAVWNNSKKTWDAGFDKDGNITTNILSVIGINAEWIRTGTLTVGGAENKNGEIFLRNSSEQIVGSIDKDGFKATTPNNSGASKISTDGLMMYSDYIDGKKAGGMRPVVWSSGFKEPGVIMHCQTGSAFIAMASYDSGARSYSPVLMYPTQELPYSTDGVKNVAANHVSFFKDIDMRGKTIKDAKINGLTITGNPTITGDAKIKGSRIIDGDVKISSSQKVIDINGCTLRNSAMTYSDGSPVYGRSLNVLAYSDTGNRQVRLRFENGLLVQSTYI